MKTAQITALLDTITPNNNFSEIGEVVAEADFNFGFSIRLGVTEVFSTAPCTLQGSPQMFAIRRPDGEIWVVYHYHHQEYVYLEARFGRNVSVAA